MLSLLLCTFLSLPQAARHLAELQMAAQDLLEGRTPTVAGPPMLQLAPAQGRTSTASMAFARRNSLDAISRGAGQTLPASALAAAASRAAAAGLGDGESNRRGKAAEKAALSRSAAAPMGPGAGDGELSIRRGSVALQNRDGRGSSRGAGSELSGLGLLPALSLPRAAGNPGSRFGGGGGGAPGSGFLGGMSGASGVTFSGATGSMITPLGPRSSVTVAAGLAGLLTTGNSSERGGVPGGGGGRSSGGGILRNTSSNAGAGDPTSVQGAGGGGLSAARSLGSALNRQTSGPTAVAGGASGSVRNFPGVGGGHVRFSVSNAMSNMVGSPRASLAQLRAGSGVGAFAAEQADAHAQALAALEAAQRAAEQRNKAAAVWDQGFVPPQRLTATRELR